MDVIQVQNRSHKEALSRRCKVVVIFGIIAGIEFWVFLVGEFYLLSILTHLFSFVKLFFHSFFGGCQPSSQRLFGAFVETRVT